MGRFLPRRSMTLAALAIGIAVAFPLGVLASHQFGDVPDANPFHDDIVALADSGVTLGCGGGNYCPTQFVTREQMAAFLNRLGALADDQTPVVNAASVDGIDTVMPGGTITVHQIGPWLPGMTVNMQIVYGAGATSFIRDSAGTAFARMHLHHPGAFGDLEYSLDRVDICYQADASSKIDATTVSATSQLAINFGLGNDDTDRSETTTTCYAVENSSVFGLPGGAMLNLNLTYTGAGQMQLGNVTTTWIPVTPP